jgi:hypothetical protein
VPLAHGVTNGMEVLYDVMGAEGSEFQLQRSSSRAVVMMLVSYNFTWFRDL